MSKSIITIENIQTGELKYVATFNQVTTAAPTYTCDVTKAMGFIDTAVMPPLKAAKRNINPSATRVYTLSA